MDTGRAALRKVATHNPSLTVLLTLVVAGALAAAYFIVSAIADTKQCIRQSGTTLPRSLTLLLWTGSLVVVLFCAAVASFGLALSVVGLFSKQQHRHPV